ncbi:DUF2306 domain-containing protein [Marinobacter nanhaiticus D15-8W]|uniref:DUF2306 domain-containing protein n=1 Tax=Marinobacter nanhaiticus D15-8W TaxID=626887 RepID=N6W1X9_9GAMM|nr:DUF2306 domain-containing protein [Marinobacter nanhaiticus]ENO14104.1 DUF2306 domain-containing protein [Marinobacter nanhaiticus D15-8W]BES71485.1 DUF2306 domain-containing protein [Marinobacter nanhaiticus D15-8W]
MTLQPLLQASPAIQVHVAAAMLALGLGVLQFFLKRGSGPHRSVGWLWIMAMALVALSSFLIHQIKLVGAWSPIHLLSAAVLVWLWVSIRAARARNYRKHGMIMGSLFCFALIGAGAFTLLPGRLMHGVVFGG